MPRPLGVVVYWSSHKPIDIDPSNREDKCWFIKQVLMHGLMSDIQTLNLTEVEELFSDLHLPEPIKELWADYFERKRIKQVSS